ncbi:hypothetical protein RGQ13_02265 [Thalassotalea psychrophila]|uniref:GlyGly-CTERM sorting domain-containing protein n=1 Tax=Thalassotalea psychrophila TaxID=3065647 RepID=A0ABY9TVN1_9GAMM|nr:hypothetical protein RGQ13_02265 [Colwelliaceae bacterium SQ149]
MTINNKNKKKLSKLALLALPFTLTALNSAQAAEFPIFGEDELYYNHISSSVRGSNLIVNPSFDILSCADYEAAVLAASVEECTDGQTWGWTNATQQGQGQDNANYAPVNDAGEQVNVSGGKIGKASINKTVTLSQAVTVVEATEIYVKYYLLHNDADGGTEPKSSVYLVVDGAEGAVVKHFIEELTEHNTNNDSTPSFAFDVSDIVGIELVDGLYTGSINLEFVNTNTKKTLFDNVFLGSNAVPADEDEDGVLDDKDAFPRDAAASIDTDEDGMPDDWNDDKTAEDSTSEPALVIDLDDDNDGDSDVDELAAGADPLSVDSHLADIDGDGWFNANDNETEFPNTDAYPRLSYVHQSGLTNVLAPNGITDYSPDAEIAILVENKLSAANNEWEWFTAKDTTAVVTHEVANGITGHDGELTNAYRLSIDAGTTEGKTIQFASPILTTENINVNIVRVAGWMKVTGPEVNDTVDAVTVQVRSNNSTDKEVSANTWTFSAESADTAIYNKDLADNNGWHYFENQYLLANDIEDIRIQLKIKADVEGVVALFDNLEINFINNGDLDEDGILDAIDRDDDNDGILDGLDDMPLGEYAGNSDDDLLLNGYDDDFDGDGIADAFDDTLPAVTSVDAPYVYDNDVVSIEVIASALNIDDAVLTYRWTLNGILLPEETSSTLNYNVVDISGEDIAFELTATAGGVSSSQSWSLTTNTWPTVGITSDNSSGEGVTFTATPNDIDGDTVNIEWFVDGLNVQVSPGAESFTLYYADFNDEVLPSIDVYAIVTDVNRPVHSGTSDTVTVFIPLKEPLDQQPNSGGSTQLGMLAMLVLGLTRRFSARTKLK